VIGDEPRLVDSALEAAADPDRASARRDDGSAPGQVARPRIIVIDDSTQTRDTFALAFPEIDVAAAFSSVDGALSQHLSADLVVLDLHLDHTPHSLDLQGPRAVRALTQAGYRVCVYTDEWRLLILAQCFSAGAAGLLRKSDPLAMNEAALLTVAAGGTAVPASMAELAHLLMRRQRLPQLTTRQTEVLTARARGQSYEAIAARLNITVKVARQHYQAVMPKLLLFLQEARLDPQASAGDVELALGLGPGDLNDPWSL
jgi:DNA-binding NarL/FixJ family response regulator